MIVELLTMEEMKHALVRYVMVKKGTPTKDVEELLKGADTSVELKNVKSPDGTTYLFATVGISTERRPATETPLPEKSDG